MLSRFDDYPIHQTPEPVAHPASSDRNVYDRYWFNGYDRDAEFYFGVGMGLYPNRGILDCGFSIARGGEQHAFHGSRRMPQDPSDTTVGPFRIDVVEPMRVIRVVLEPNETGIACDLRFTARTACVEEGRQIAKRGHRMYMDATRFAQYGRWHGVIRYAGKTIEIDPSRVYGTKDRSWGIRPVGEPDMGGAPQFEMPQFFFLWAPLQWKNRCTHFGIFDDVDGRPWHFDGAVLPLYDAHDKIPSVEDPGTRKMVGGTHRLTYVKGTRYAESAVLSMTSTDGERMEIALEPKLRFHMKGIGYQHPEWAHGWWRGELAIGGDSWKTADLDPLAFENLHVQQVVRARMGSEEGIGVLEQFCIGPYRPYGFEELVDGAK
jgi:hypothetical protein